MEALFGLEIHQQLQTSKLHCHCKSILSDKVKNKIKRELHVRAGELGEKDIAAQYEEIKHKYFEYEIDPEYCCLVELDEEPPRSPNIEAIKIALEIAKIFDAEIVDRAYVMRKTIIDGSNVSGFQRTTLIAYDGRIIVDGKEIRIPTICLEEDAARKILTTKEKVIYRLDRLGIPLIEISTEPVKGSPKFARRIAEEIGLSLRMLGKVRRGLGTIRQDVNVSIEGGNRVELKGVPKLELIEKAIEYEIYRQKKLLEVRDILKHRGIKEEDFTPKIVDVSEVFRNTSSLLIKRNLEKGLKAIAINAPGFKGLFSFEILPGKRIGKELAEILMALTEFKGLLHSDEISKYHVSEKEIQEVRKLLELDKNDGFIIILGKEGLAKEALLLIFERLKHFIIGVPKEVRKVLEDGTSMFLRPMPGAARMYPETDIPPLELRPLIKEIEIIPPIWVLREKYSKLGLNDEIINELLREATWKLFEKIYEKHKNIPAIEIAKLIVYTIPRIEEKLGYKLNDEEKIRVVEFLLKHQINLKFIVELINYSKQYNCELEQAFKLLHPPIEEIRKIIIQLINNNVKEEREIIKTLMKKFEGKIDVNLVKNIISEINEMGNNRTTN